MTNEEFDEILERTNAVVCNREWYERAVKALEIVKEVKQIVDEWNDEITEPEEDMYYLCHIKQLFEQKVRLGNDKRRGNRTIKNLKRR